MRFFRYFGAAGAALAATLVFAAGATGGDPVNFKAAIATQLTFLGGGSAGAGWGGQTSGDYPRFGHSDVVVFLNRSGHTFIYPSVEDLYGEWIELRITSASGDEANILATVGYRPWATPMLPATGTWTLRFGTGRFSRMSGTGTFTAGGSLDGTVTIALSGTLRPS